MRGFVFGCLFCGSSVVFGAILTHALKASLMDTQIATLETAAKYLFYVGVPLLMLQLTQKEWAWPTSIYNSFILSGLLFSGSLMLLALSKQPIFGWITPLGGILMIGSWGYLLWLGYNR